MTACFKLVGALAAPIRAQGSVCLISLLFQWLRSPSGICHLQSRAMCLPGLSYGWTDGHLHTAISLLALCSRRAVRLAWPFAAVRPTRCGSGCSCVCPSAYGVSRLVLIGAVGVYGIGHSCSRGVYTGGGDCILLDLSSSPQHFISIHFPIQDQELGPHISSGLSKKSSREMYSSAMAQHM